MSSLLTSMNDYIAAQPKLNRRRKYLHKLLTWLSKPLVRIEATGTENIPSSGSAILMMNHISGLDPIVVTIAVKNRYVISMSKAENLKNPLFRALIDVWGGYYIQRGIVDRKALQNTVELLKSDQLVLIAPEGTRHPEGLAPAKDGLAYLATKADAIVIPATVSGAQDWKSRLKRLQRAYTRVNFGRPFKFKTDGRKRIPRDELQTMMQEAMYQMAVAIPDEYGDFRGVYSDVENATTNLLEFIDPNTLKNT